MEKKEIFSLVCKTVVESCRLAISFVVSLFIMSPWLLFLSFSSTVILFLDYLVIEAFFPLIISPDKVFRFCFILSSSVVLVGFVFDYFKELCLLEEAEWFYLH